MRLDDSQCGQAAPSGQRIVRMISKHSASSMRSRMFTMIQSPDDTEFLHRYIWDERTG